LNHSNRALYQTSIWTSLEEQQAKFTYIPLILDGKWRKIDRHPAGQYFQKPLKHAVNCWSVDARKVRKAVVADVSGPMYHALNSVVAQVADRIKNP